MLPKGVLFDFDGVVVDSFKAHYNAWNSAYQEMFEKEVPPFPKEKLSGKSPLIIADYFCEQVGQKERGKELFLRKGKYLHNSGVPPNLLPGVVEIQTFLAENNLPHGIASNASRNFVKNSVKQLELGFEVMFGVEDYTNPKPHPEPYIMLAKQLGFSESEFSSLWVCEDSVTGTVAAKEAGMIPIGILTQFTEKELREAGSQLIFPTLLEAYQYLKEQ